MYDVHKFENDRARNVSVVNMRLKYDYVILPSKDLQCVTSRQTLMEDKALQSGRKSQMTPKLKLPKDKMNITAQQKRLTKLQSIIKKATSRFDDDYQVRKLNELHQDFLNQQ